MLTICGTYQLFGHYFKTWTGKKIPGISIFNAFTIASKKRKIGNIVIRLNSQTCLLSNLPSLKLVGFENHSGNTFLKKNKTSEVVLRLRRISEVKKQSEETQRVRETHPLGKTIKGFGNNGQDKTEGAVYKNALGTYLHGPILPKNPHLADWLIKKALEVKYQKKIVLKTLDDRLEWQAHQKASRL